MSARPVGLKALRTPRRTLLDNGTLQPALDEVEQRMRHLSAGDRLERAGVMAQEHLATGGRRIRARLALAATACLDADPARAVAWATAVELLHNATLIHDDIQDGDRGLGLELREDHDSYKQVGE